MLKEVCFINYNSKIYLIRIFKGGEKILRERPLNRQKIIVSANICRAGLRYAFSYVGAHCASQLLISL